MLQWEVLISPLTLSSDWFQKIGLEYWNGLLDYWTGIPDWNAEMA